MNPVVIIPALNPDEKLILLVEELQKQDLHTIVVDDGSGAEYAAIFELLKSKYACDVCTHPSNCGKGRALKTGIRFLLDKYPDSTGFCDGGCRWATRGRKHRGNRRRAGRKSAGTGDGRTEFQGAGHSLPQPLRQQNDFFDFPRRNRHPLPRYPDRTAGRSDAVR